MKTIIGVDEVGRGPIAGPLCVCAFRCKVDQRKFQITISKFQKENNILLRDSKKLSRKDRELWMKQIKKWQKEGICEYACSYVHASTIDRIGISKSARLAVARSLAKINASPKHKILLDGSLYAPDEFIYQETIIKGDEKIPIISLASIVAKVYRDKYMRKIAKQYPKYGFENHVGYGTKEHQKALIKYGPIKAHRHTFLTKLRS